MEPTNDKKSMQVVINAGWCKSCGICMEFCPKGALVKDNKGKAIWQYPEKCNRCGLCELRCPDLAITIQKSEEDV